MKALALASLIFLAAFTAQAQTQNSNSLPFTAVTTPAAPVLTSLNGLSPTGKIYTGQKMPIIGTGFSSACVVNVDGTAQPAASFVFVSATEIDFTIPAGQGSATGAAHTATVTCPLAQLSNNIPVTLPNATGGQLYSQDLKTQFKPAGGTGGPYTWTVAQGSLLPTGLNLSPSGVVSGTPSGVGSIKVSFDFSVSDAASACANDTGALARHAFPPIEKSPLFRL